MRHGFINHLHLTVLDFRKSITFYTVVLGWLGYRWNSDSVDEPSWALSYQDLTLTIALREAGNSTPHNRYAVGLHHLAFHLTSRAQVDAFHKFLLEESIPILEPPTEYDYTPGYYAVFFPDPDGIKLEVVYEPRFDGPVV